MKLNKREPISMKDFNAMMKYPKPEGLKEVRHPLVGDYDNVWYEYVPKSYTGKKKVPLVLQIHGGGWGGKQCAYTHYDHYTAEQEEFIVVYPDSPNFERWLCNLEDCDYITKLIQHMATRYEIDLSRVYIQGLSNGDMMTMCYSLNCPLKLAGAGNITGALPESMVLYEPLGPVPIAQMRGEKDIDFPHMDKDWSDPYSVKEGANDYDRKLWMRVNEVHSIPKIHIHGKDNFVMYTGEKADILYWEVKDQGHLQPPHLMQVFWEYLYSAYSRVDGRLVKGKPKKVFQGDEDSFAIAVGSRDVYINGKIETMDMLPSAWTIHVYPSNQLKPELPDVGEMRNTDAIYAPIGLLERVYGAKITLVNGGDEARVELSDGKEIVFLDQSLTVYINREVFGLNKPSMYIDGAFYIPVRDVMAELFNSFVCVVNDVVYVSKHYVDLTRGTARIIKEILQVPVFEKSFPQTSGLKKEDAENMSVEKGGEM